MEKRSFSSKIKSILILVTILALPGFLYILLEEKGVNNYKALPIYGEKTLSGTFTSRMGKEIPDTTYHLVDSFSLLNQANELIHYPLSDSTISIVHFFYTGCESFCDNMYVEMSRVANKVINQKTIRLLSISVDTLRDTPEVLKEFSQPYGIDTLKWDFLGKGPSDVFQIAKEEFLLDAVQDPSDSTKFIHSSSLVLVDSRRRIRGYYDTNQKKEVDRLIDEIKVLLIEESRLKIPKNPLRK